MRETFRNTLYTTYCVSQRKNHLWISSYQIYPEKHTPIFWTVFSRLYTCEANMKDGEKDGHQMHEEIHSIHPTENTKR